MLQPFHDTWPQVAIRIRIDRDGNLLGSTSTRPIRRSPAELVEYLGRCLAFLMAPCC